MKAITVREAQGQLGQLVAEACRGETIALTDGENEVTLSPARFWILKRTARSWSRNC